MMIVYPYLVHLQCHGRFLFPFEGNACHFLITEKSQLEESSITLVL